MAQQQFGYTPVSSGINTTPLVTQSQPGMYFNNKSRAASDIESIMNAALQVGKVYGEYKEEQNKITENETNLQLLNVKLDHQEKLNQLNDNDVEGYKQLTNSYRTKADNILEQSELTDESRLALTTSITETAGMFNNHVTKAVKIIENKQATEGVTAAIANLHNAPVDDNTRVVFAGLKETLKATGKTDIEVEDFLAEQYLSTKLSTIDKDNTSIAEMDSLLITSDEFIKSNISSNMINKELHFKFKNTVNTIKDGMMKEELHTLTQYAENDATSLKVFKSMVEQSKASGALDDITAANLLQQKNDNVIKQQAAIQAKELANNKKIASYYKDKVEALKSDPYADPKVLEGLLQQGVDNGYLLQEEATSISNQKLEARRVAGDKSIDEVNKEQRKELFNLIDNEAISENDRNTIIQKAVESNLLSSNEASKIVGNRMIKAEEALKTEKEKQQAAITKQIKAQTRTAINEIKVSGKTIPGITPAQLKSNMMAITLDEGTAVSQEDVKFLQDYEEQYKIENTLEGATKLFKTTSNDYNDKGKEGAKKGVDTTIDRFFNDEFNPQAVISLYDRHHTQGTIDKVATNDLRDVNKSFSLVTKLKALDDVSPSSTRKMLGDDNYAIYKRLSSQITLKETSKSKLSKDLTTEDYEITRNNHIAIMDIVNNPVALSKDSLAVWDTYVASNPKAFHEKARYDTYVKTGISSTDALAIIKQDIDKQMPVATTEKAWFGAGVKKTELSGNVFLEGYRHNLNEDDVSLLSYLPDSVNIASQGKYNGIAYNRADSTFYYSRPGDMYANPITDSSGNRFSKLEGTGGVLNYLSDKTRSQINNTIAGKVNNILKKAIGEVGDVKIPTQEEINAFTQSMKR